MSDSGEAADASTTEVRIQLLLAEWEWASGLIRYHREVELKALGGAGIVISAVVAAYAALESGEGADPARAEAIVLAAASCVSAFLVLVAMMASMRAMRAAAYVREWLHPLSVSLSGDPRYLAWELVADRLYQGLAGPFGRGVLLRIVASTTVLVLVAACSVLLAVAAWSVDDGVVPRLLAAGGAASALVLATVGALFAELWERADEAPAHLRAHLAERAVMAARVPVPASLEDDEARG